MKEDVDWLVSIKEELEWLRYFYAHAKNGMGPADDDIYQMIKDSYVEDGGVLPKEYITNEEEE